MKRWVVSLLLVILLVPAFAIGTFANVIFINDDGESINMTGLFKAESFTSSKGTKINYRIYLPNDYSTEKEYPLILFLHGAGQAGSDNESQLKLGICEPFKNKSSEIYDCIVLAPQCPSGCKWVDVQNWGDCKYDSEKIPESAPLAAVVELFIRTRTAYSVDKDRVYVTGLSMGGYGTWDLLVRHPDLFAAAMPLCGGADYRKAELIKDIPIWTFHGKLDGTVPYLGTEKMANTLKELGGNCRFTLYPTMEHGIWPTVYAREDILPWLLSKKLSDRMEETTAVEEESTGLPEPTTGSTEQPSPKRSSCRSAVIGAAPVAGAVVISAFALKKKKED